MSTDCNLFKYESGIDSNAIPKYGEFKFKVKSGSSIAGFRVRIPYASIGDVSARIVGDTFFTDSSGNPLTPARELVSSAQDFNIYLGAGEGYVFINCKYNFISVIALQNTDRIEFPFEQLVYNTNDAHSVIDLGLYGVSPVSVYGDLSDYGNINLRQLQVRDCNKLTGSLDNIVSNNPINGSVAFGGTNLSLDLESVKDKDITVLSPSGFVYGDIKYLADISDTNIRISAAAAPNITGSIEQFVSRFLSKHSGTAGSRTFSVTTPKNFTHVTYQGTALSENGNVPDGSNKKFSWDAQGNITWS